MTRPDTTRLSQLGTAAGVAASVLVVVSLIDVRLRHPKPNPFEPDPRVGVPTLADPPWHPMVHTDPSRLPWVIDPVEAWPATLRDQGQTHCGLAKVLQVRYPLWLPEAARRAPDPSHPHCLGPEALTSAGFTEGNPDRDGPMLQATNDGWVLERRGATELALVKQQGLVFRLRPTGGGTP
ncbi:MAG: hypothetical protein AAFS10_00800 [Myxococcota bacterium]